MDSDELTTFQELIGVLRWAVAAGEDCIGWISGKYNLSDVLTKRLTKERRQELFWNWTY